ncbi:recombinase family protein [Cohaesibacter sp. CAU 1516]|uniref:recombinase family protein n=1 Tax=Cohaesibacter sp. CAU 1516 TaxID=2576038 RepID=UPI0010FD0774|nr:recombinase family protein [Cohaesibacter sp. CAU 1516]TLP43449.1 recombinase family protein [Cohaesibacter sp. CAU 1516]
MSFMPELKCHGRLMGYARVSTPEQKLDLQIDCLNSAGCIRIFKDHGISGAKAKRPGLDDMLAALKRDDMVVVYKLDRLGRSVLHLSDLLVRFQREGIHFSSLSEGINTATPAGQLTFHLFSAVAEFQRQIIAENTAAGLHAARRRGTRLGRPRRLSEKQAIDAAHTITKTGRRREDVAKRLGVSRMTLDRAIRRVGATA